MAVIPNLLRSLQRKLLRQNVSFTKTMLSKTRTLLCDPSSITFCNFDALVSDADTEDALRVASRLLDENQVVVFPTETVYGLGAVATNEDAVSRIFSTKGRPPDNPLIVHVSSLDMLRTLLPPDYTLSQTYKALIDTFWPGPLTLLFPRDPARIPSIVSAGQATVAVRMPSHPIARALITISNAPIAAPSANSSGKPSPTRAIHVERDLGGKVDLILDGGPCGVGLESTVVDGLQPDGIIRVLRPGGVTVEQIERVLLEHLPEGDRAPNVLVHKRDYNDVNLEQAPTTPGMKYRHYSPSIPVTLLLTWSPSLNDERTLTASAYFQSLLEGGHSPEKLGLLITDDSALSQSLTSFNGIKWYRYSLGSVKDPAGVARRLFDGILTLEREGVERILVEEIPEDQEGLAVMNRLRKAASETQLITVDEDATM